MPKRQRKKLPFLVPTIFICIAFLCLSWWWLFPSKNQSSVSAPVSPAISNYSELDGGVVSSATGTMPRVVGVMIDNHPDARPQAGISSARIVYEAPVEGSFTRYFALFDADQTVDKVGPVRSARPYFLDWQAEYGTLAYMHSGGSPDALDEIKNRKIFDTNEFFWGEYYWRSAEADAPHNLFTSSKLWQSLLKKYGARYPETDWQGWKFGDVPVATTSPVKAITINYNSNYSVGWAYQPLPARYGRIVNGKISSDQEGRSVVADNIVILEMSVKVLDDYGRKAITTVGTGDARVIRRGEMVRGIWKKNTVIDRTRFFDKQDNEIALAPGITWVEIVPPDTEIQITR